MLSDYSLSLTVFPILMIGLIFWLIVCARNWRFAIVVRAEENAAAQENKEETIRQLKKALSNGLKVKEWVPDNPPDESAEGDQDAPPSGGKVELRQPTALPVSASSASCAMGSDDCDPLVKEEETAGCAICLSQFTSKQLVCESNNASCQHVFHKDCMVDWLMKNHDNCPMCREVYLLVKTV